MNSPSRAMLAQDRPPATQRAELRDAAPARDPVIEPALLNLAIATAQDALRRAQAADGSWAFELEADATIPSEFILLGHFLDEVDAPVEMMLARYLRSAQGVHGGWPLFSEGSFDLSASVKAYYALKLAGDEPSAPHMRRARQAILAHGGAARANVFTRITLALFRQVPWRAVPAMPAEIMLLPRWFPFHLTKVSYWSRTVIVPLLVLLALKPAARNPRGIGIAELFTTPPAEETGYLTNPTGKVLGDVFLGLDRMVRALEPMFPRSMRRRSIEKAVAWFTERLNGDDGLGGIFPAMTNALCAMRALGHASDHPDFVRTREAIRRLLVFKDGAAYCQPCVSPVWDTGLAVHALLEAGESGDGPTVRRAADWLRERQIVDVRGDWSENRSTLAPGGWAFQYRNDHYPDTDDSAMVVMALERCGNAEYSPTVRRGLDWIIGMQSANGGWGSFDADNTHAYLNHIPFADHGALLDPPTSDVTARCVGALAQCGYDRTHPSVARGVAFLKREQEADGSWFGRWGTNYIYGTWSALAALNAVGEDPSAPCMRRAVEWLKKRQRRDGGWGEDCASYWPERKLDVRESTPSQTAWAVIALMSAGEVHSREVASGIDYLLRTRGPDGMWEDALYNAVGFPRVFFLKYHGYARYFPLWALARYRNLRAGNQTTTPFGM